MVVVVVMLVIGGGGEGAARRTEQGGGGGGLHEGREVGGRGDEGCGGPAGVLRLPAPAHF